MNILSVENIGKAYRVYRREWHRFARWFGFSFKPSQETWVLKHLSFSIQPGETIGIVGQNGAGKSTLLKIIAGTLKPTEGQMQVNGRIAAILELGMGFDPELTGRQNVGHAVALMGFSTAQIDDKMPTIEAFAEIGDYFDKPVRTYSSGMQMRLAFAVATAWRPDILIVDEALSVGDAYFQAKCYKHIDKFKKKGTTLLLVSHSTDDVVKHCERAIMLKNGSIEMDGSARTVSNRYLDELFGKKSSSDEDTVFVPTLEYSLLSGREDEFHTRPGYYAEEYRWGHGGAQILDYLVVADGQHYPSRIESNTKVGFYFKVLFDANFDNVVPGFLIKTHEGIFLYGTNSFLSSRGQERVSANVGDVKVFCFSMSLALNEGHYMLSFGISSGDPQGELVPLDRRYDSVMLHVGNTLPFWGIADLKAFFHCAEFPAGAVER